MRVGVHEAIHGVGHVPSTMISGAQTAFALCGAISNLCNSVVHFFSTIHDLAINPRKEHHQTGTQ